MKPFNLEKALAGEKVVTRDGQEVTQLTLFDAKDTDYTLVGVIDGLTCTFTEAGKAIAWKTSGTDLFMATTTKEVTVYIYDTGEYVTSSNVEGMDSTGWILLKTITVAVEV